MNMMAQMMAKLNDKGKGVEGNSSGLGPKEGRQEIGDTKRSSG